MKKLLAIALIAVSFTACSEGEKTEETTVTGDSTTIVTPDTTTMVTPDTTTIVTPDTTTTTTTTPAP